MPNQPEDIPEIPKPPRFEWQPVFGAERAAYQTRRNENIAELATYIGEEVLSLYFPEIAEESPEMTEALALRWATGLRNKFEEGIQAGIEMERKRTRKHSGDGAQSAWPSRPNGGWTS